MNQKELLHQINTETNSKLRYFFLNQYLNKYYLISEINNDNDFVEKEYIYFLYEKSIYVIGISKVINLKEECIKDFISKKRPVTEENINYTIDNHLYKIKKK